ncbi:hypothetical protein EVAR_22451_1 [Eumeta japonica]|uniref:Uncharacterized protein n=1 Tax=Eumeta variegata TaxID=151549 RepID=A0A4C1VCG9_EUMVA|nr:hypothetical protein EVAR_22451_1 [Eumeta japonica]
MTPDRMAELIRRARAADSPSVDGRSVFDSRFNQNLTFECGENSVCIQKFENEKFQGSAVWWRKFETDSEPCNTSKKNKHKSCCIKFYYFLTNDVHSP